MITYDNQANSKSDEDIPPLGSGRIICHEEGYKGWGNEECQTFDELNVCHDERAILSEKPKITFGIEISLD